MKIAVTSLGENLNSYVSEKFGRCPYFIIYNTDDNSFITIQNEGNSQQSAAGPKAAETIINNNVDILITGNIGDKANAVLQKSKIKLITGYTEDLTITKALNKYNENEKH